MCVRINIESVWYVRVLDSNSVTLESSDSIEFTRTRSQFRVETRSHLTLDARTPGSLLLVASTSWPPQLTVPVRSYDYDQWKINGQSWKPCITCNRVPHNKTGTVRQRWIFIDSDLIRPSCPAARARPCRRLGPCSVCLFSLVCLM